MAKYKVKNTTILHNGVAQEEGSIIELTEKQAKRLEDFVELVEENAPAKSQNNSKQTKGKKSEAKTETKTETKKEDQTVTEGGSKDGE